MSTHQGNKPRAALGLGWGLALLWVLALILAMVGLGRLPLRDWDEAIVARVALEASQRPWPDLLMPVYWGDPYLNKPPGLHLLIVAAIGLWRELSGSAPTSLPPEWLLRLVPAVLSSTVVPLVGLVQARLRPHQPTVALASAAMALTLMPLARHGRLVMLDGSQLAAILVIWWAVLTPHRRPGALLLQGAWMGLAGSALLLLKAPLAFPLLGATLILRALDRDLELRHWRWLLTGLLIGLLPGLAWHGAHLLVRGSDALQMWGSQGFARVHQRLEGHSGGPLMAITEVLEGGWPWLALWPGAMGLAWRERRQRAGRWCLGTTLITAGLVLPLRTQLPWYSQLLWPPLLLTCGPVLVWLVHGQPWLKPAWVAVTGRVPAFWALLGGILCTLTLVAIATGNGALAPLVPLAATGGLALLVGGGLLLAKGRRSRQAGVIVLVAGLWGTLLLLMAGPLWLWELNEQWSVLPIAKVAMERPGASIHLWEQEERPSLNWYAGRRLSRLKENSWQEFQAKHPQPKGRDREEPPLLLITADKREPELAGASCRPVPSAAQIFTCSPGTPPGRSRKQPPS
ncbi:MAG: ArnT family glycosyltransferase [Cyanobium sp.]